MVADAVKDVTRKLRKIDHLDMPTSSKELKLTSLIIQIQQPLKYLQAP